ncbi:MAG: hypothetical protein JWR77_156 [Rhizorhabdus sp.]|nr:hypothetical protein [Rhizorhabdus sp.]
MTSAELRDILLAALVRETGSSRRRWSLVLGEIKLYSLATHPHCNWTINPSGSIGDVARVERLCDDMRGRHPIVTR